ncbi:MAG: hypothetical protein HY237_00130 [Acidobacteria bacterium]|nr:hypothetical protein [Acidobacteriota bacterium]
MIARLPQSQLPGSRWLAWLRNATLRVGLLTGIYLSIVLAAWMLIANRVPWSAKFAHARNLGAAAVMAVLMLIPVLRFLRSPARLFASGVVGWAVLSWTYVMLGLYFERLYSRKGPLHVFMLGAVVYGSAAVVAWVASMVLAARRHHHHHHQSVAVSRRRMY